MTVATNKVAGTSDLSDTQAVVAPAMESPSPAVIDLFLLCYIPSPLFHAHWSLFVPGQEDLPQGTVLNVRGNPLNGFVHEFVRGYVPSEDPDKPPFMVKLGSVKGSLVSSSQFLEPGVDAVPQTELERLALSIPAPGPSLGRSASKDGRTRVEIRDCQWWMGQFVDRMIETGILQLEAQRVLEQAPKH